MAKTFFEVLKQQIEKDLREQVRKEVEEELEQKYGPRHTTHQFAKTHADAMTAKSARMETWLVTQLGKTYFSSKEQPRGAYRTNPRTVRESVRESDPHSSHFSQTSPSNLDDRIKIHQVHYRAELPEEVFAIEVISRLADVRIPQELTVDVLKSAWRRAALRTHPDRFAQADAVSQARATAQFREVMAAFEVLSRAFEKKAA